MADVLVLDWLDEFEFLTECEFHTFAAEQEHNQEIILSIYVILGDTSKSKYGNLPERICKQFFAFNRSGEEHLKHFVLQFIPSLILLHLNDKKLCPSLEPLLISVYNLDIVDSKGQPRVISFRLPSIAQSSIYHDSSNLESAFLAENALRRWEECNTKLVNWGPLPQVESFNAQNRQRVLAALTFLYNQYVANINIQSVEHACKAISRIVSQGFISSGSSRTSTESDTLHSALFPHRLAVSSPLLIEFLHVTYHALERGANGAGQTLNDITQRATYECYADVLLVAYAVRNALHFSPAVSVSLPQPHSVSKTMITNASFRTKKLPDDIPIQTEESEAPLSSITEEQEDTEKNRTRSGSALKHLPKLPGLSKKPKHQNKGSPTPQRHSAEPEPTTDNIEMRIAAGAGDQVSLVSGAFSDTSGGDETPHAVHVSAV
ncbi:hyccin [Agrilus planipennis]|uniref:Hyccin n=1 Tax=Agrilus planipennis TaxID=224129 RepID=A0A1W4X5L4_AGRPL|nr:hyccin [Agrilus planipennis]